MPKCASNSNGNHQQRREQRQRQPQRSRVGASVRKPKTDIEQDKLLYFDKQLAKASDLEAQLGALSRSSKTGNATQGKGNVNVNDHSQKIQKLQSHLCEILSDVLISNPKVSLEKDCFHRLWRGCFYKPIQIWRKKVSREKRKRSPNIADTKEGFKHFLSEAVTLYDYLIVQYLSKLCPSSTQQDGTAGSGASPNTGITRQTQQSKDTYTTYDKSQLEDTQFASQSTLATTEAPEAPPIEGVVQGLYKLYIFMGDLHRYAEAYNKAETNYSNAAKLGPGLGNPYNQLAVVAFAKETYCVALYWYARSLMATHERFSTSPNNLERLFTSNREFLREHGRDSGAPTVLSQTNTANKSNGYGNINGNISGNGNSKSGKNKTNSNSSMLRAQKVVASKSCLTHFVDLHCDLFLLKQQQQQQQSSSSNNADADMDCDDKERLRGKIKNVSASLKSLVQASGFSDSLLCKIVVINSFSLERSSSVDGAKAKAAASTNTANSLIDLAKDLFYSLGLVLAQHTEGLLEKSLEKAASHKSAPSVRCLLPLEMMLDFCNLSLLQNKNGDDVDVEDYSAADPNPTEIEFWKLVALVGNLTRNVVNGYKIIIDSDDTNDEENNRGGVEDGGSANSSAPHWTQIKEYQLLKGYRPFSIVNEEYLSNDAGFLDAEEAVNVLELTVPSQSQDTGALSTISAGGGGGGGPQENKARLLRMLQVCDQLASSSSAAPLALKNDAYNYQEKKSSSPLIEDLTTWNGDGDASTGASFDQDEPESQEGGHGFGGDDDSDDEAGDIIIYHETKKETVKNDTFSLPMIPIAETIVPLPSDGTEEKSKFPMRFTEPANANGGDAVMTVAEEQKLSSPVVPSLIKPPPGFGGSPTTPTPISNPTTSVPTYSGEPLVAHYHLSPMPTNQTANPPGMPLPPLSSPGRGILDQVIQGRAALADSSSLLFQMPQQQHQQHSILPIAGLMANSMHQDPLYSFQTGRSNFPSSVEESIHIFGDMRTANPFVMETPPLAFSVSNNGNNQSVNHNGHHDNFVPSIIPDFVAESANTSDGTKWLNSNLLNSLWMDETSETKNPWASK